jgi:hypothetical protein
VLLSQDEACFPMVPTLSSTLGVKGHRPEVGTWDCKDLLYVFAVVNVVTAALPTNMLESPKDAKRQTGQSKTARMQEAFAAHLRHVGRVYPREKHKRVVVLIDNAPWHACQATIVFPFRVASTQNVTVIRPRFFGLLSSLPSADSGFVWPLVIDFEVAVARLRFGPTMASGTRP